MHIILGGTGHVGSAVARALLARGEQVTVVTRAAAHAGALAQAGARVAAVDVRDVAALRALLRSGRRAFVLNPPAPPSGDTDAEESANVAAILAALDGAGLEKVVAASAYGARPGRACGDLTVLHGLEEGLRKGSIPAAINRGAYYMSNWAGMLEAVRASGKLTSFFPADHALPMVAPEDLGAAAARRLLAPPDDTGVMHVEGPARYSAREVAKAFAAALGRPVEVETVPRAAWEQTFVRLGFSPRAARSYACMTATVVDEGAAWPEAPERGPTTLRDYIGRVVAASGQNAGRRP